MSVCDICGGTGIRIMLVAYEDEQGVVHHDENRLVCDGCNGSGKEKERQHE